jgi:hypothetical protein
LTTGCIFIQLIRRACWRITFRLLSSDPPHFCSSALQHLSIGFYLL